MREMSEETGYPADSAVLVKNVLPFEEIFVGSNYRAYTHRYFLMRMDYTRSLAIGDFQKKEVSCMEWKTYAACIACIRPYNPEKRAVITNVHTALSRHKAIQVIESFGDMSSNS